MPYEYKGYEKSASFMNGHIMEQITIEYILHSKESKYLFSLRLERNEMVVMKKDGNVYYPYKTFSFNHAKEGIQKLFESIDRYSLKSLI